MANFPQLEPLNRSYDLGAHIVSTVAGQNGDATQFLHSAHAADVTIALDFQALSSAQVQLIRDHYTGQRGTALPFEIVAEQWRTHTSLYDIVLPAMSYRYAGPPTETPRDGSLFDVSLSLVSHF